MLESQMINSGKGYVSQVKQIVLRAYHCDGFIALSFFSVYICPLCLPACMRVCVCVCVCVMGRIA